MTELDLTPEQEAALALDRNVVITAGAGTGKTTTLEARYRHILERHPDLDPTNVVTITFTRDATAELRDGIREMVDEQLADAGPEGYARWRRAKDALEDAYVHTIHGFCSRLLREYAVEAAVHPDFETLDETESGALVARVANEVISAALGEGAGTDAVQLPAYRLAGIADDVDRLAALYGRGQLVELVRGLIEERPESDEWADRQLDLTTDEYLEAVFERAMPIDADEVEALLDDPAIEDALETIESLAEMECGFTADEDDGLATIDRVSGHLGDDVRDLQRALTELCDAVTTNDGDVYSQTYRYAGTASRWDSHGLTDEHAAFKTACDTLIDGLDPASRNLEMDFDAAESAAPYVFSIARLYRNVRDEYAARKDRRNALDYTDLIEATVDFLASHDRARRELREQFAYLMVDEVQDTDPRQWDLVRLLTGSEAPAIDGENVFLVGDEKQSIYRFRRADVSAVREVREEVRPANSPGVDSEGELSGNFRTLEGPLDFLNALFEEIFTPEDPEEGRRPDEAEPQQLTAARTEGTDIDGTIEYLVTPERAEDVDALGMAGTWLDDPSYESRADREAAAVAARLTQLFDDPPTVYDREAGEYRPAEPRDVALLFRTKSRLRAFERALESCAIPYTSVGGQSLYETPEIEPLVNLLRVLQDPSRDVPLYGVLRSPLFGFTDDALAGLYRPEHSLYEELQEADGRLGAAADRLAMWRQAAKEGATKWAALCSRVIDETGYLVGVGADERPTQAVVNVNQFRERMRSWEEGAALPLADVLARIEREMEFGRDIGEGEIPTDIEGVQLRTVHSAKGLQFPIVVVPELGRGSGGGAAISDGTGRFAHDLAQFETVHGEPVLGICGQDPDNPLETAKTPDWELARAVKEAEERAEEKRVLYVAMTRVRDHLFLSSTHRFDEEHAFGPVPTGADAECWRDWVQPLLLEDRELLEELQSAGIAERQFDGTMYTVRRPEAPVDGPGRATRELDGVGLELPAPPAQQPRSVLTATDFRDLVTQESPHNGPFFGQEFREESVSGTAFGDLVHRLSELALAGRAIDWETDPIRLVEDPAVLTDEDIERAKAHVESVVAHVRSTEGDLGVRSRGDEVPVTLDLPEGRIVGDIDHLTVTDERYHVTDYKTDTIRGDVEVLAHHYWPQLEAYACALQEAAPKDGVVLRLIFTQADIVKTRELTAAELREIRTTIARRLAEHVGHEAT